MEKISTKNCPKCGNTQLALTRSLGYKTCIKHKKHVKIPWYLDKGQEPLQ